MGLFVCFTKNTYSYTKWHGESKKIGPHLWKWPEMAVFGEYLQKMADSDRKLRLQLSRF